MDELASPWSELVAMQGPMFGNLERLYRAYRPRLPLHEDTFQKIRIFLLQNNISDDPVKVKAKKMVQELWDRNERQWITDATSRPCGIRVKNGKLNEDDADSWHIVHLLFRKSHRVSAIPHIWRDALVLLKITQLPSHDMEEPLISLERLQDHQWSPVVGNPGREPIAFEVVAHLLAASGKSHKWLKRKLVAYVERAMKSTEVESESSCL